MQKLLKEVVLYGAASALAFALDVCLLWALVEYAHIHYLLAAAFAFIAGTVVAYTLSIRTIFSYRSVADARLEFTAFAAVGVVGLIVNLAVLRIAVGTLGVHFLVGKMVSVVFTFSLNFGLRRFLLFSRRDCVRGLSAREPSN